MATILVPRTASFVLRGELYGQEIINIVYAEKTNEGPWSVELLASCLQGVMLSMKTTLAPQQSAFYSCVEGIATDLGVYGGNQYVESNPLYTWSGAIGGDSLPGGSAFVVKFLTGRVGRSFRGRNFIAGIPEASANTGRVIGAFTDAVVQAYSDLGDVFTENLAHWVIVSRTFAGSPVVPPARWEVTSVGFTTNAIRSQRKRNVGIGA